MEKLKSLLIAALIAVIIVFGAVYSRTSPDNFASKEKILKDSIAVISEEKEILNKSIVLRIADKGIWVKTASRLSAELVSIKVSYKPKVIKIEKYKALQVDSAFAAAYPVPVVADPDTSVSCNPNWRIKAAELDLIAGSEAIELNKVLVKEDSAKEKIIADDNLIIDKLQKKDTLNTQQASLSEQEHAIESAKDKKEISRLKRRNFKTIVIGVGIFVVKMLISKHA